MFKVMKTLVMMFVSALLAGALISCGSYEGAGQSAGSDVAVSAEGKNNAPVADAGPDQAVLTGTVVTLDGSGSYDPDNDPLTYSWAFLSVPAGSTAAISATSAEVTDFTPDIGGVYEVSLTVSDGSKDDTDIVVVKAARAVPVTDTQQTLENEYPPVDGEDADYTINPPVFVDNGDGTVSETVTGLMWQQNAGSGVWENAASYCDGLTLGGHDDWRVPHTQELISMFSYADTTSNFAIDTTYFPQGIGDPSDWWSSVTYVDSPKKTSYAFVFDSLGELYRKDKELSAGIRCVRGEAYRPVQVLMDNGDGTVSDMASNLMWQQGESTYTYRFIEDVVPYCEGLSHAGYDDWRVPNAKELASLLDHTRVEPAADSLVFPTFQPTQYHCSSTLWEVITNNIFEVIFVTGELTIHGRDCYAKCVRGGE